jgi:hypothetical protein
MCTLLGPEGPDLGGTARWLRWTFLWILVLVHRMVFRGWWIGRGYRPYFENYTVDASIYILATRTWAFRGLGSLVRVLFVSMTSRAFIGSGKALVFLQFC